MFYHSGNVLRFPATYKAALLANGLTASQASIIAGIKQSAVSRFLSGTRPIYAEHVAALIKALPDQSDREHCALAFLRDQCPPDLADRLVAHFGTVAEARPTVIRDELDDALDAIRRAIADGNTSARKVVVNLGKAIDPGPAANRTSGGGPADTFSRSA